MKRVYIPGVATSYSGYNSGGKYKPGGYRDYNKGGKWSAGARYKRYSNNQFSPIYQKFYPSLMRRSEFGDGAHVNSGDSDEVGEGNGFFEFKRNGGGRRRGRLPTGYRRASQG